MALDNAVLSVEKPVLFSRYNDLPDYRDELQNGDYQQAHRDPTDAFLYRQFPLAILAFLASLVGALLWSRDSDRNRWLGGLLAVSGWLAFSLVLRGILL